MMLGGLKVMTGGSDMMLGGLSLPNSTIHDKGHHEDVRDSTKCQRWQSARASLPL